LPPCGTILPRRTRTRIILRRLQLQRPWAWKLLRTCAKNVRQSIGYPRRYLQHFVDASLEDVSCTSTDNFFHYHSSRTHQIANCNFVEYNQPRLSRNQTKKPDPGKASDLLSLYGFGFGYGLRMAKGQKTNGLGANGLFCFPVVPSCTLLQYVIIPMVILSAFAHLCSLYVVVLNAESSTTS
jgi:hypothetical protein